MSLYGALFAGVSGLQSQSSAMGAIADNVTNVNTIGYKGTNVNFKTLVTKQVSSTKYSPGGVQSAPIKGVDIQGLLQATTSSTDLGISGKGFFVVSDQAKNSSGFGYSRAGSFKVDKDGYLQNVSGYYMQGWPLENWDGTATAATVSKDGNIYQKSYKNTSGDTYYMNDNAVDNTNLQPLNLQTIGGTARATSTLAIGANLPGATDVTVGTTAKTNAPIFDTLGNSHNLDFTWTKRASNSWDVQAKPPKGATYVAIDDQSSARATAYAVGRMDFDAVPASGQSFTMQVANQAYTFNFSDTIGDQGMLDLGLNSYVSDIDEAGAGIQVNTGFASGQTVTVNGTTYQLFDSGAGDPDPTAGATVGVDVGIAASSASDIASALVTAINTQEGGTPASANGEFVILDGITASADSGGSLDMNAPTLTGIAEGATVTFNAGGTSVTFTLTNNATRSTDIDISGLTSTTEIRDQLVETAEAYFDANYGAGNYVRSNDGGGQGFESVFAVTGTSKLLSHVAATDSDLDGTLAGNAAGTAGNAFSIGVAGQSLSQVLDSLGKQINTLLATAYGKPPTVPGNWGGRIAGENGIQFRQADSTYATRVDASSLRDDNGDPAVLQNVAFDVPALDSSVSWTNTSSTNAYSVTFNGDGSIDKIFGQDETGSSDPRVQLRVGWANGAEDMDGSASSAISMFVGNYNSKDGLQQLADDYQLNYLSQNGNKFGNFAGVSMGEDGVVTALFDNGVTTPIFMIPLATFVNPNGMSSVTGNVFQQTDVSGLPTIREAGTAGSGTIAGGTLESSTVDLGEEFTSMITTQRAYSAAAKIITTSDEMLDELIRIKR